MTGEEGGVRGGSGVYVRLTLLVALVAGVLQREADGTVVPRAVLPMRNNLSRGRAMSHCREKVSERES